MGGDLVDDQGDFGLGFVVAVFWRSVSSKAKQGAVESARNPCTRFGAGLVELNPSLADQVELLWGTIGGWQPQAVAADRIHVNGQVGTAHHAVNRQFHREDVYGSVRPEANDRDRRPLFSVASFALCSHRVLKLALVNGIVAVGVNGQKLFPRRQVFHAERAGCIVVGSVENAIAVAVERTECFIPAFSSLGLVFFNAGRGPRAPKALLFSTQLVIDKFDRPFPQRILAGTRPPSRLKAQIKRAYLRPADVGRSQGPRPSGRLRLEIGQNYRPPCADEPTHPVCVAGGSLPPFR